MDYKLNENTLKVIRNCEFSVGTCNLLGTIYLTYKTQTYCEHFPSSNERKYKLENNLRIERLEIQ